jgi:hypothetical protein
VVLADFTNTTGDPVFDGTLRQGLVAPGGAALRELLVRCRPAKILRKGMVEPIPQVDREVSFRLQPPWAGGLVAWD